MKPYHTKNIEITNASLISLNIKLVFKFLLLPVWFFFNFFESGSK